MVVGDTVAVNDSSVDDMACQSKELERKGAKEKKGVRGWAYVGGVRDQIKQALTRERRRIHATRGPPGHRSN